MNMFFKRQHGWFPFFIKLLKVIHFDTCFHHLLVLFNPTFIAYIVVFTTPLFFVTTPHKKSKTKKSSLHPNTDGIIRGGLQI